MVIDLIKRKSGIFRKGVHLWLYAFIFKKCLILGGERENENENESLIGSLL